MFPPIFSPLSLVYPPSHARPPIPSILLVFPSGSLSSSSPGPPSRPNNGCQKFERLPNAQSSFSPPAVKLRAPRSASAWILLLQMIEMCCILRQIPLFNSGYKIHVIWMKPLCHYAVVPELAILPTYLQERTWFLIIFEDLTSNIVKQFARIFASPAANDASMTKCMCRPKSPLSLGSGLASGEAFPLAPWCAVILDRERSWGERWCCYALLQPLHCSGVRMLMNSTVLKILTCEMQ